MLAEKRGSKKETFYDDYVVFDLETTGISCKNDQIIEISAVKVKGGEMIEEFSTLVNPGREIPYYASQVNGITDEMVEDAPDISEVMGDFIEFIGDFPLVGHNIHAFDMKFIYRDCEMLFGRVPDNIYVDTLLLSRHLFPQMQHHKLSDMAELFDIDNEQAHRALSDARANQMVYESLKGAATEDRDYKKCPFCGSLLVKRNGRYGLFWGCGSFPDCKYTEDA